VTEGICVSVRERETECLSVGFALSKAWKSSTSRAMLMNELQSMIKSCHAERMHKQNKMMSHTERDYAQMRQAIGWYV